MLIQQYPANLINSHNRASTGTHMTDRDLPGMGQSAITPQVIRKAQRGDADARSMIYQAYAPMIYRYIAYRVGETQDVEDLTSEVFVRVVQDLPRYKDTGAPFEAWLYRIASARVADFYRKRKRRSHVSLMETLKSDSPQPEDRMLEAEEVKQLRQALSRLKEQEQNILIMRFVERLSHDEVAVITGKSVSAVKSIQHRALIRLTQLLGSEEKVRHYLRGEQ